MTLIVAFARTLPRCAPTCAREEILPCEPARRRCLNDDPVTRMPGTNPSCRIHCFLTRSLPHPALVFEQPMLSPQPSTISGERAVRSNDAMTWNDDYDLICSV